MMKFSIVVLAVALVFLVAVHSDVYAVGYERYEVNGGREQQVKSTASNGKGLYKAVKDATFVDKVPAVLDEVAFFVRDILGQFGLRSHRDN